MSTLGPWNLLGVTVQTATSGSAAAVSDTRLRREVALAAALPQIQYRFTENLSATLGAPCSAAVRVQDGARAGEPGNHVTGESSGAYHTWTEQGVAPIRDRDESTCVCAGRSERNHPPRLYPESARTSEAGGRLATVACRRDPARPRLAIPTRSRSARRAPPRPPKPARRCRRRPRSAGRPTRDTCEGSGASRGSAFDHTLLMRCRSRRSMPCSRLRSSRHQRHGVALLPATGAAMRCT